MKHATLCFLFRSGAQRQVLLGLKKRGFGVGKFNGFGGKIMHGESPCAAAVREIEEESGLIVTPEDLRPVGNLTFVFPRHSDFDHFAHIFIADTWEGNPRESEEMRPAWFSVDRIPYDRMWQDDPHWLPLILGGRTVRGEFTFGPDNETVVDFTVVDTGPASQ